jgi:hypothetical protein
MTNRAEYNQDAHSLASAIAHLENAILKSSIGERNSLMNSWNRVKAQLVGVSAAQAATDADQPVVLGMAFDRGIEAAHAGVHEVMAGFEDLPFEGCPEAWAEKPFARIRWFEDGGDRSAGIPAMAGWTLDADQAGTVLEDLAMRAIEDDATPPTPAQVLADRSASRWLLAAIRDSLQRDPVDAANDAQILAAVFRRRAEEVLTQARENLDRAAMRLTPA